MVRPPPRSTLPDTLSLHAALPISSRNTPWYDGPPLLSLLETLPVAATPVSPSPRFFVQWVIRHGGSQVDDFRGYAGQLIGGALSVNDEIKALPSGLTARVARLLRGGVDVQTAVGGDSVTVVLDRDIDVSRGDLVVPIAANIKLAKIGRAHV